MPVPLMVMVPTLVPVVSERVNDTASALSDIPSSLDLSVEDISPSLVGVATPNVAPTADMT